MKSFHLTKYFSIEHVYYLRILSFSFRTTTVFNIGSIPY